jgi:hypothetical protein
MPQQGSKFNRGIVILVHFKAKIRILKYKKYGFYALYIEKTDL